MGLFKLLFCLIFLLHLAIIISGKNICRASKCGEILVKFPFRLQNRQPTNCGYLGFELRCNSQGYISLELPQSGEFFVQSIDYLRQEIRLYDPSGCVANRLVNLNLSGSPFIAIAYQQFFFLSCSSQSVSSSFAVGCLSDSTNTVVAMPTLSATLFPENCEYLYGRPIQVPRSYPSNNDVFSKFSRLGDDIPLRWDVPDCGSCESRGRTCEFDYNSGRVTCHKHRTAANGAKIFGLITSLITICGLVVSFIICLTRSGRMSATAAATTTTAQFENIYPHAGGLDETTIQSYTKIVLGESCRLPGGEIDGTCTICLCEYTAKEEVKCIPECKHCFHAGCIDEWLRLTGTCPICRITPSPSPIYAGP